MPSTERGRFDLLHCRRNGVEAVQADTARAFVRHTHEQFGVGLMRRGAQRSASGRGMVEAGAGDIITVNPGEVHDGAPLGEGGRSWSMLYLQPALVAEVAADIAHAGSGTAFEFRRPALTDEHAASLFHGLFHALTAPGACSPDLEAEQALLLLLGRLLGSQPDESRAIPAGIAAARAWMDEDPTAALTLAALSREAGLGRYQFIRAFSRATGLTPHAYLLQRRVHRARHLIGRGLPLAEAAAGSGFADQSHMTRLFVRMFGVSPGAYARAMR